MNKADRSKSLIEEMINQDLLTRLFESTKGLHERFGDDWTIQHATRKMFEEVAELTMAMHDDKSEIDDIAHELTDVLVTMLSCYLKFFHLDSRDNAAVDLLKGAIEAVIIKNDAKTLETHERANGMIVRKK